MTMISASELLTSLKNMSIPKLLDVRSELEFEEGSIPRSLNLPILNNHERHLVGSEYKQKGQSAAIELGLSIVAPHRLSRIRQWCEAIDQNPHAALACWRGGLRSKIACEWIRQQNREILRVEGGYKNVRNELLKVIQNPPSLIVLGGWTGSGKTQILENLSGNKVDFEALAHHRGSCFGEKLLADGQIDRQPSQATFENAIAFEFWNKNGAFVVEDESTRIGRLNIPKPIKDQMKVSPVVFLDSPADERALHIYQEYIASALHEGIDSSKVAQFFLDRLKFLKRHLGGAEHERFESDINEAFTSGAQEDHLNWIKNLLVQHYDKAYEFAFQRLERKILFHGNRQECFEYLQSQSR